ncbi:DNA polymerase III PolC-type [bioreactor metagenome]|uniref:DNA polymerase III PolC-type n=1 Tax=bioreactor metagenome TaxID=1076179 RepID=A0A645DW30_9ZZZZ
MLVAHNASFDVGFLKVWSQIYGLKFAYTYIDTLPISRFLFKDLKKHKLDTIAKHLNLPAFSHHRASDDSKVLCEIFKIMQERLKAEHKIENISKINEAIAGDFNYKTARPAHQIILVKNYEGLKNLYRLISISHLEHYYKRPRILKSLLLQHQDGLILGTACDAGELHTAVREGRPFDELIKIADFYDFLEIQPVANAAHLVRSGQVENEDKLRQINKTIVSLGQKIKKPVVATGDVHFLNPEDEVYRRIIMSGQGYADAEEQAPLYLRTTEDMLQEFSYLGQEKAFEVVVKNTNLVADMCEEIRPVPQGNFPPSMDRAPEDLEEMSRQRAQEIYGSPLPDIVRERLDKELSSVIGHG